MTRALITGITGQDGSYLAELLLEKGYEVYGIQRPASSINTGRIDQIYDRLHMEYADLLDGRSMMRIVKEAQPHEIYNLAAQSHVQISFQMPVYTNYVNYISTRSLLGYAKMELDHAVKFYQASSSEIFGNAETPTQNEQTWTRPCSPYGESKLRAFEATIKVRHPFEAPRMHAVNGILFNHTSPRQKETFVVRKITRAAARIRMGLQNRLYLGNLDARRDFGHAKDYVRAMWMMMQHPEPDDFVIATGESRSVREVCEEAFGLLNLDWRKYVSVSERLFRPTELHSLCGDASKARKELGWEPTIGFKELIKEMVDAELCAPLSQAEAAEATRLRAAARSLFRSAISE